MFRNQDSESVEEKIQFIKDEAYKQRQIAEAIASKYGMTLEMFDMYIKNPSNFSADEWSKIQNAKKTLLEKINAYRAKKVGKVKNRKWLSI